MAKDEDTGSPGWSASFFMQTTEDIARAVAAAAAAATAAHSPRPSVIFSAKDDSGSHLQKLQRHFSRVLRGLSTPPEVKYSNYNPEVLTSQMRQWASFQLQYLVWIILFFTSKHMKISSGSLIFYLLLIPVSRDDLTYLFCTMCRITGLLKSRQGSLRAWWLLDFIHIVTCRRSRNVTLLESRRVLGSCEPPSSVSINLVWNPILNPRCVLLFLFFFF